MIYLAGKISAILTSVYEAKQYCILLTTLICLNACTLYDGQNVTGDNHFLPFRIIGNNVPVVEVRLNEKKAWFIIDTGSSFTFLNLQEAGNFGFHIRTIRADDLKNISGLGGTMLLYETVSCKIGLGYLSIKNYPWKSGDISRLTNIIKDHENINIVGILGADFLSKYRMNINYETRTLSYRLTERTMKK